MKMFRMLMATTAEPRHITVGIVIAVLIVMIMSGEVYATDTIEIGDYIAINVVGDEDFNRVVTVESDGTIAYPYIDEVPISGLTISELQVILVRTLQSYLDNPVVFVEILERYSITIQILGQVKNPGLIEIPSHLDVQSAVTLAGGMTELADPSKVHVLRKEIDNSDESLRLKADLTEFMLTGNLDLLPELQENDIVIVPGASKNSYITVIGAVQNAGNYIPYPESDVLQIILQAGGLSERANSKNIKLLRFVDTGKYDEHIVNLEKLIRNNNIHLIPRVSGGDIIIVQERGGFLDWDNTFKFMRNITILGSMYIIAKRL